MANSESSERIFMPKRSAGQGSDLGEDYFFAFKKITAGQQSGLDALRTSLHLQVVNGLPLTTPRAQRKYPGACRSFGFDGLGTYADNVGGKSPEILARKFAKISS